MNMQMVVNLSTFQNNLEPKDIGKYVSNKVREMFFKLPV